MSDRIGRRRALLGLGIGTAGLLVGARRGFARAGSDPVDPADLADRIRAASADDAFDVVARAIASGVDRSALLAAVFFAGLSDIRPRPHGILHVVMMVESVFQLGDVERGREAWLPALFNLYDLKRAQERDRDEVADWSMPPRPDVKRRGAESARREFGEAMDAWNPERADRAVVALLPHVDHAAMFELLWPLAARCSTYIGHKMIYVAQVERALARFGGLHAEVALRSVVRTLLWQRDTALFDENVERAQGWPDTKPRGTDPDESLALYRALRHATPGEASEAVRSASADGVAPATVWDAMRLFGSEVFHRRPGRRAIDGRGALLPVHALTVENAFGHAWRTSRDPATRRALMLQAASMLATMRDGLGDMVGLSMDGSAFEELGTSAEGDLDAAFAAGSPAIARAALDRDPTSVPAYLARVRRTFARNALEHHQHKYLAAMQEEATLIHPRWRSLIFAPAIDYVAHPDDEPTDVFRRSVLALEDAGVGE